MVKLSFIFSGFVKGLVVRFRAFGLGFVQLYFLPFLELRSNVLFLGRFFFDFLLFFIAFAAAFNLNLLVGDILGFLDDMLRLF
jgi:hypothetical protein